MVLALLMMGSVALAEEVKPLSPLWSGNGSISVGTTDPGPMSLRIQTGKSPEAFVTIQPDGTIIYGKDYAPDEAAKALWDAVGGERRARDCK
jgi:hypothetical protein